jgi:benzoate membrane transport protein
MDPVRNLRDLPRHLNAAGASAAVVAWLWSLSPLLITLTAARQANLSPAATVSWIACIHLVGGVLSVVLSLCYRQPVVGAFTIPGAVLVGTALTHLPFDQVVGTYWLVGVAVIMIGATGIVRAVTARLPLPVMMGMVAGVLLPFVLAFVRAVQQAPVLCGLTAAAFFVVGAVPGLRRVPPVLAALVVGLGAATALGHADWTAMTLTVAAPQLVIPAFSLQASLELVVPLVVMVVAAQNMQGFAALIAAGYQPQVSALTTIAGVGSLISALGGGHPASIAGPSTAIVAGAASGPRESRYAASVLLGLLWVVTGLLAPSATAITRVLPRGLLDTLGGLALLVPMSQFLHQAFAGRERVAALIAFLVTTSGIVLFRVAAPFWALVAGMAVATATSSTPAATLERNDSD